MSRFCIVSSCLFCQNFSIFKSICSRILGVFLLVSFLLILDRCIVKLRDFRQGYAFYVHLKQCGVPTLQMMPRRPKEAGTPRLGVKREEIEQKEKQKSWCSETRASAAIFEQAAACSGILRQRVVCIKIKVLICLKSQELILYSTNSR